MGVSYHPTWEMVLNYEHEVRKKGYELVNEQKKSIVEALGLAITNEETRVLRLTTFFNADVAIRAVEAAAQMQAQQARPQQPRPLPSMRAPLPGVQNAFSNGPAGKGAKGNLKNDNKDSRGMYSKTEDGELICFAFNKADGCGGRCGMKHLCQKCQSTGHNRLDPNCPKRGSDKGNKGVGKGKSK